MTWIIPKNLHTSAFVPDMEALTLDLKESSQILEQSVLVRSKLTQLRTWLRKWKRDSWMQHLYGRILKPFHGQNFTEKWTSSVGGFLVNPSQMPEKEKEMKTQDIYFHISKEELQLSDLPLFSLKTLQASSQVNLDQVEKMKKGRPFCFMSSESWKDWITKQRQEYSVRVNAVRHINAKEFLYSHVQMKPWGTPGSGMAKAPSGQIKKDGIDLKAWSGKLENQVCQMHGHLSEDKSKSHGNHQGKLKPWATPYAGQYKNATLSMKAAQKRIQDQRQECLQAQSYQEIKSKKIVKAKLNPRWVETLMGLPIGWTMVNCVNPYAIELMNSECLEMEFYHKQQKEHSEHCGQNWATPNTLDYLSLRSDKALIKQATTTRKGRTLPSNLREQVDPHFCEKWDSVYKKTSPHKR
tara:strand:- start:603 stop:1829 length:1227 start_codon:yes stop_codon:yes gene_type:complete